MHSFLITNWSVHPQDLPDFLQRLLPRQDSLHHPDILLIEPHPAISISQIRDLKVWLSRRPYQATTKVAIFLEAHTLTLPAQHALLKSLEEPPPDTYIFLSTNHPNSLLPTIHSRCQLITLNQPHILQVKPLPHLPAKVGERLALAQTYTTKDQALNFCQDLIYSLESQLKTNLSFAPQLRLAQQAHNQIQANVNPKLALEHLLLNL